jgi:hypothetical protein
MFGEFASEAALQSYQHLERSLIDRAQAAIDQSSAILRPAGCEIEAMLRRGDARSRIASLLGGGWRRPLRNPKLARPHLGTRTE